MDAAAPPKVSFVSLGCPKALVDSERIITRLRAEGYELSRDHRGADVALVNTCGFLDSAKAESLAAIARALKENGKVIVTGCMGAVEKAAGVDHCEVGAGMGTSEFIALRAQAGHDALAVDQRLRAAERDETHSRHARRGMSIFHGEGLPERAVGSKRPGLSALVPDRRH